jgi:hypothetical protein
LLSHGVANVFVRSLLSYNPLNIEFRRSLVGKNG